MDCFSPVYLKDQGIYVRCNKCPACLAYRQQAWITRLMVEQQTSENSYFVTLTYDEDHVPKQPAYFDFEGNELYPECCVPRKWDVQRLNKYIRRKKEQGFFLVEIPDPSSPLCPFSGQRIPISSSKMSFYLVSEYGPETLRPHYHGLYFNVDDDRFKVELLFRQLWRLGFVQVDECTPATINYVTKYLLQNKLLPDLPEYLPRPFSLMSKGLGIDLLTPSMLSWWRENPSCRVYVPEHGTKKVMSRYYKDKVFDDDMKARISDKYAQHHSVPEWDPDTEHLQQEYVRQRRNLMLKKSVLK